MPDFDPFDEDVVVECEDADDTTPPEPDEALETNYPTIDVRRPNWSYPTSRHGWFF